MPPLAIMEAFQELPDLRRGAGRRHSQALCLALFTLAVSAGCRGFLAIKCLCRINCVFYKD
ncbi:MAG: transposase family protein [Acaryochloridaceae cyanobacterium RL_2_7]|nr:transposase family protein [Acaryochloridaceae cyanobacterium RL_2_7]